MKIQLGNLFNLAEQQLDSEIDSGKRSNYTGLDVINHAVIIRYWLDNNELRFSKEEQKQRHARSQKLYEERKKLEKV